MLNRRDFLRKAAMGAGLLTTGAFPFRALAAGTETRLTILHTNDTHSRLEPFPMDGSKMQGQGGVAARAAVIEQIREEEEHVLLLDAGDVFQGTPYFNMYRGEAEIKAMSLMGYDAMTMGNHDFDIGVEGFALQLPHARFAVVTSNYDFTGTALEGKTVPYRIFRKGNVKIGIFGLGIDLNGIVPAAAFGRTRYLDPIAVARSVSEDLRKKQRCDMVICLSHLGFKYDFNKVSDHVIARETEFVDLIIGGHTHTFLDHPVAVKNRAGNDVLINQVGWGGLRLGKLDFIFDSKKNTKRFNAQTVFPGKQTIG